MKRAPKPKAAPPAPPATTMALKTLLDAEGDGGDAGVVAGIAHTLKSSSASVGALELSRVCADVESRLRRGEAADLGHDIERLVAAARVAKRSVAAILRP